MCPEDPKLWAFFLKISRANRLTRAADSAAMLAVIARGGGKVGQNLTPKQAKSRAAYYRRRALALLRAARAIRV